MNSILINNKSYEVIKTLGRGKGGYSYLVSDKNSLYVAKKIHHEPCSYYKFSNKLESEYNAYLKLHEIGIKVPFLIDIDKENEIILKQYIEGETIDRFVLSDNMKEIYYSQIKNYAEICKTHKINLDYFPTNFVVKDDRIYYIDYECNEYSDEWNYDNWGSKYWSKTEDFLNYFSSTSKELIGEKLILRKMRKDDAEAMFNNWTSDNEVTKYLTWKTHENIEETKNYLRFCLEEYNKENVYRWGIVEINSHTLIGMIDVVKFVDGIPEVGYVLSRRFWGQGIMTEAFKMVCEYLFSVGYKSIMIRADKENIGSNRVIIKNGFIFVKETKEIKDDKTITINNYIKNKD